MKKIFLLLSIVLIFSSCDDFLDTENVTNKTTENFPETQKDADEMLTSIYSQLLFESPENSSEYYIAQLAADDCLGGNLSFSGNCATNFLMYKDNLNSLTGLWARDYRLINRANNAINTFPNVKSWESVVEKNRHYGEAYFLRAIAYYELAQVFGGVPIRTTIAAVNIPRDSVEAVYNLIASDLKNAIEMLPNKIYVGTAMDGHATKAAAQAYMARVFLFYTGRYGKETLPNGTTKQDVIGWINECVNSGHALVNDQRNLWSYTNESSESNSADLKYQYVVKNNLKWVGNGSIETLFANKHNMKSNWTYTWWSNTCSQFFSPSADNYSSKASYPFGTGWGAGPVSPAMVNEWKAWSKAQKYINPRQTEDPRLTGSIWSYKAMDPNKKGQVLMDARLDDSEPEYTVSYRYYEQTGYFQKKYININAWDGKSTVPFSKVMYPDMSTQTSQSLLNISDLIHMRFADVLLMQSELTQTADGLNRVRARSGLAPVAYSIDAIKQERRWELCFEGLRWWDMLRWAGPTLEEAGQELNKQNNFDVINAAIKVPMIYYDYSIRLKKTQGYWPIPQDEIDLSNGVLKQNPGWDASAQFIDWTKM